MTKLMHRLSIRARLYLALGILALIAVCASATVAWRSEGDYEGARAAFAANATADLLLQAAGNWAAERGMTNTALNSPLPLPAETRAAIDQRRDAGDRASGLALQRVADRRDAANGIAKLNRLRQSLTELRARADVAMAQPLQDRPAELVEAWLPGITAVIEASQGLRQESAFHGATTAAELALLQQMKQATWVVSEYAGRERAVLGAIIVAGHAIAPDRLVELGSYRGRVELAWNDIQSVLATTQASPAIRKAANDVRDAFFGRFQAVRTEVYASGLSARAYPLTGQQWVSEATSAIDTVLQLSRSTGEAAARLAAASAASEQRAAWFSLASLAFGLGIAVAAIVTVSFQVTRPLTRMSDATRQLARGELGAEIPCQGWTDELGALASSIAVLRDGLLEKLDLERAQDEARAQRAAEQQRWHAKAEQEAAAAALVVSTVGGALERLAARDLSFQLVAVLPGDYDKLRLDLNGTISELQDAMGGIVERVDGIRSGTGEIAKASDDLSRRTEQQAASLEEIAAALEEVTVTVRKTAEGATRASVSVGKTKADAELSGTIVRRAVDAMGKIEQSSREISQIIGVIDEIAFQTNLLSLNAGVEAARAGEAGRGFAVVATEVRALAQRSAKAAKEIKTLISASAEQVDLGVKFVGETGEALGRIVSQVADITTAVSEMAIAANKQANGLHEVNAGVNQMDKATQQNAAMAEQSTAATHALDHETAELSRLTERFDLERLSKLLTECA